MANLAYASGRWVNTEKPGGQVLFVGGGTVAYRGIGASDTNDGLTPERPLATIDGTNGAVNKCVTERGDTVVVLPGTVTITAALALDVADLTLTGYTVTGPKTRSPSIITCATDSVEMINVDAANVTVENLTLTNTATTADVFLIDVGDTTASNGTILRNLFVDCSGGADTVNGIRIGDGTVVSSMCVIDGCIVYDNDDVGITVGDNSLGTLIRNTDVVDTITANEGLYGMQIAGESTRIENCFVKNSVAGAAGRCISVDGTALKSTIRDTTLVAFGAAGHGLYIANDATVTATGMHIVANAAGDAVEFADTVDGLSGITGWESSPADGTICELINPGVTN